MAEENWKLLKLLLQHQANEKGAGKLYLLVKSTLFQHRLSFLIRSLDSFWPIFFQMLPYAIYQERGEFVGFHFALFFPQLELHSSEVLQINGTVCNPFSQGLRVNRIHKWFAIYFRRICTSLMNFVISYLLISSTSILGKQISEDYIFYTFWILEIISIKRPNLFQWINSNSNGLLTPNSLFCTTWNRKNNSHKKRENFPQWNYNWFKKKCQFAECKLSLASCNFVSAHTATHTVTMQELQTCSCTLQWLSESVSCRNCCKILVSTGMK